jgi:hypothetical protein
MAKPSIKSNPKVNQIFEDLEQSVDLRGVGIECLFRDLQLFLEIR